MRQLENIPFEELTVGQTDSLTRTLTEEDLLLFAKVSGDTNPVHLDKDYAATTQFEGRIAHGMWTSSLISCALATKLPGPGGIYLSQEVKFMRPVKVGDTVTVKLEVLDINERRKRATVSTNVVNQDGKTVVKGKAEIMPAVEKVVVDEYPLPEVELKA
ncbi:3-hydroxybutyryl-CoA dehydratase [Endozoicomonas montiporae]|uniref:3-hydroxybutyryl-CoA dehydratase n=2 Tax=Endozoicomonas montiporae TaxID=1027273 RepID=A0A081N548_9GAMM|nr:MaoC family dehydratase [Endozoicomonas montiporae]AMO57551.1 3-hydroxybutyryl-CoA dehydratase [Endozoicomonas montiporae CL-33]KEQ13571.1 3-hydroxybutyryl-CoA dehydratase [Endozoicomonas montiporae]